MIAIIGLGNPGKRFFSNRHNLGFSVLSLFKREKGFPVFKKEKKFQALVSSKIVDGKKVFLIKPQAFMNNSGQTAALFFHYYHLSLDCLWVIHDELGLFLGQIKISQGRGSAGHKGVESVIRALSSQGFVRFRLGIRPLKGAIADQKDFVLEDFSRREKPIVRNLKKKACQALTTALEKGIARAANSFNQS